jgi:uncharacterized protein involved in exopolysaccharide biosynthesis
VALLAGTALAAALAVSLLVTKKYTATVTLLIEPPPGTVVSPIYLESLRTYEHLAASDHLFAQAVERFRLRQDAPGRPLERLKRAVLRVAVPRSTKILQISATLPSAARARELALYLAQETIRLNRETNRAGDDELIAATRRLVEAAVARTKAAEAARAKAAPGATRPQMDALDAEVQSAWVAQDEQEQRLRALEATAGHRGERLMLLDPGVAPERPSWPNLPLNLAAALALALAASWLYLTLQFGLRR